jgi:Flp pilus assembly pilin Flp
MRKLKANLRVQRGQGLVEYGLILGLIATAIIVVTSISR